MLITEHFSIGQKNQTPTTYVSLNATFEKSRHFLKIWLKIDPKKYDIVEMQGWNFFSILLNY